VKIGVVTIDDDLQQLLIAETRKEGHKAIVFQSLLQALSAELNLVFAQWPQGEHLADFLQGLRESTDTAQRVPIIALVPSGSVTLMQRARLAGATDVLFYPPDVEEVRAELREASQADELLDSSYVAKFRELRHQQLIGESQVFRSCLEELKLAARCDANVLLVGETGTGKEVFAKAIHELSRRSGNPFVAINCASLPGGLLEAELFGHVKGAFTGAEAARVGRFEAAGAGTLLLDEIADIEINLQTKLLRVIEQRVFQRLGTNMDVSFNARLICATSVDLPAAIDLGRFRSDLLGRINQFRIVIPAIRERKTDIPVLTRHFLLKHARGRPVDISKTALEILETYNYPMNVRQLENAVVGALARSYPGSLILPKHLPEDLTGTRAHSDEEYRVVKLPKKLSYKNARAFVVKAVDNLFLGNLLQKYGGNHTRAAEDAGIDRKTFNERLEQAVSVEDNVGDD